MCERAARIEGARPAHARDPWPRGGWGHALSWSLPCNGVSRLGRVRGAAAAVCSVAKVLFVRLRTPQRAFGCTGNVVWVYSAENCCGSYPAPDRCKLGPTNTETKLVVGVRGGQVLFSAAKLHLLLTVPTCAAAPARARWRHLSRTCSTQQAVRRPLC